MGFKYRSAAEVCRTSASTDFVPAQNSSATSARDFFCTSALELQTTFTKFYHSRLTTWGQFLADLTPRFCRCGRNSVKCSRHLHSIISQKQSRRFAWNWQRSNALRECQFVAPFHAIWHHHCGRSSCRPSFQNTTKDKRRCHSEKPSSKTVTELVESPYDIVLCPIASPNDRLHPPFWCTPTDTLLFTRRFVGRSKGNSAKVRPRKKA